MGEGGGAEGTSFLGAAAPPAAATTALGIQSVARGGSVSLALGGVEVLLVVKLGGADGLFFFVAAAPPTAPVTTLVGVQFVASRNAISLSLGKRQVHVVLGRRGRCGAASKVSLGWRRRRGSCCGLFGRGAAGK